MLWPCKELTLATCCRLSKSVTCARFYDFIVVTRPPDSRKINRIQAKLISIKLTHTKASSEFQRTITKTQALRHESGQRKKKTFPLMTTLARKQFLSNLFEFSLLNKVKKPIGPWEDRPTIFYLKVWTLPLFILYLD